MNKHKYNNEVDEAYVYARIGMALVSAQRVEFVTGQLLELLAEFDKDIYGITTSDFLNHKDLKKRNKTLGQIFKLLKLNPKLVIETVLDEYRDKRNLLVHNFWGSYLNTKSLEQARVAVEFCYEFGMLSNALESFFKGFLYFLSLRHVSNGSQLDDSMKNWKNDFTFFMEALKKKDFVQTRHH